MAVTECANTLQEFRQNTSAAFSLSGPVPSIDQLVFLFDLFELSGDVHGLLDFIANVLMPDEEIPIQLPPVSPAVGTVPSKSILTVAMLRRYHTSLSLLPDHLARVFRG